MKIDVWGLTHLGWVTAACLAADGHSVSARDFCPTKPVHALNEPGLAELVTAGLDSGRLCVEAPYARVDTDLVWVTWDTPTADNGAKLEPWRITEYVRQMVHVILPKGVPILISSQVPLGFTSELAQKLGRRLAYSPENLRRGKAIECFRKPERVVIGVDVDDDRVLLADLFAPYTEHVEWMSTRAAEMLKHVLNSFLALNATFASECANLATSYGVEWADIERALRSDVRFGPKSYVAAGPPLTGGTLLREVHNLHRLASCRGIPTPLADAIVVADGMLA